ncbi:Stp1, partial [Streptococcus agalactiae COH1]
DYPVVNSDGLTNMLSNADIATVLPQEKTLDDKNQDLITLANHRGGLDNITVALVYVESEAV